MNSLWLTSSGLCLAFVAHSTEAFLATPRFAVTSGSRLVLAVAPEGAPVFDLAALDQCRTPDDAAFEEWCERGGIVSPYLGVRTTPTSMGGRGVFARTDLFKDEIVATIPARRVLTAATARGAFPRLGCALEEVGGDLGWAAELTAFALRASEARWVRWDVPTAPWAATTAEWIGAWGGGGGTPLKGAEAFDEAAVASLAATARAATTAVCAELDDRASLYAFRRAALLALGADCAGEPDAPSALDEDVAIAALYALVLSRAVALPDAWGEGAVGVVPLHDMLNHAPAARTNVELVTHPNRADLALVVTADVAAGAELLTPYHCFEGGGDEGQRVKTLLQYGMPPDAGESAAAPSSSGPGRSTGVARSFMERLGSVFS